MSTRPSTFAPLLAALVLGLPGCQKARANEAPALPDASIAAPLTVAAGRDSVVFAGGCFWGVEAVFERVKGVTSVVSGYAGGTVANPSYEMVSSSRTGHAEAVKIVYDPSVVSYAQLLKIFFSVAHDPTQLNYQGPDHGTQYRSAIFYSSAEQKAQTEGYVAQLTQARTFRAPIVTQVASWQTFWPAEDYHQGYYDQHPDQYYIVVNDKPKVAALQQQFPALYRAR
ncbi:MAG: peptide-methionine (S)-S-oxide reductase MsrA [Gemmatimonadota bacterium]